ncbi:MAG: PAS domain S-box protein [Nitrospirae bacterium]|nr:PAS domain S-box protein [Nitrospirota bacterium]
MDENTNSLAFGQPHPDGVFLNDDSNILNTLRDAVEKNAELYKKTTEHLNRITVIYELTKAIISLNNFDELLKKITEEVAKLFNASGSMIRFMEDDSLKIKASYGVPPELIDAISVGLGEGLAGTSAKEGRTILVKSAEEFGPITPVINIRTAVSIPLKIGNEVIGTFGIFDKKNPDGSDASFTEEDVTMLEGFATIAAIVIEKSIIYENALRQEREANEARKQVEELKDYLQGLIENSADAIVTSDLNGIVKSWNLGAEKIYGFTREEAIGRFLPYLPEFLAEIENDYTGKVRRGETLKDIETIRRTKDGKLIDVNLTLSPIKNISGDVIAISGIARDITEKKRVEKDLLRRNSELARLLFISSAMRGTLDLDRLLRMVLTSVTMGDGLGFNRAMLFLLDEEKNSLKGAMGVGPASHEEAWEIWSRLSTEQKDLNSIMEEIEKGPLKKDSFMDRLCSSVVVPLEELTILTLAVKERRSFNVTDIHSESLSDPILIQQLGTSAYAVVPLVSQDRVIGAIWVDNMFSRRPITEHDMEILQGFTNQIASAIENVRLFDQVTRAEQELENIFESISDMLYVADKNYIIKKINKAVIKTVGKTAAEILGKKSSDIFGDIAAEWEACPMPAGGSQHDAFVRELEDLNLGGTYLVSCSPIINVSGDVIGTVHLLRDITELKKLRERVTFTERMAALGEMAAKVAHEIRNPLLSIGGFARRLEKQVDSGVKEYAKIIVDEVGRLESMLNDTLSFVKVSPIHKREVELGELINNIIHLLDPAVVYRGNILRTEYDQPITAKVDPDRLKEAVINVVTNANQSTDMGTITIRAYKAQSDENTDHNNYAVLEIEDDGPGIKDEDIKRIFNPFFTTRSTGTGLGLSITKRIIEDHGGRIEVKSAVGKGTRFNFYLPMDE